MHGILGLVPTLLLTAAPALTQKPEVEGGVVGALDAEQAKALGVVFDYDEPPKPVKITRPKYPKRAFKKDIEGTVVVEIIINASGRVSQARVRESVPDLDAAALKCVRAWIFMPAKKAGQPVVTRAVAPVTFRIVEKPAASKQ